MLGVDDDVSTGSPMFAQIGASFARAAEAMAEEDDGSGGTGGGQKDADWNIAGVLSVNGEVEGLRFRIAGESKGIVG